MGGKGQWAIRRGPSFLEERKWYKIDHFFVCFFLLDRGPLLEIRKKNQKDIRSVTDMLESGWVF